MQFNAKEIDDLKFATIIQPGWLNVFHFLSLDMNPPQYMILYLSSITNYLTFYYSTKVAIFSSQGGMQCSLVRHVVITR